MKEKIIEKAKSLFLQMGFKSITMDDIAEEMGISKKTIYGNWASKIALIKDVIDSIFYDIKEKIEVIQATSENPIIELYQVKKEVFQYMVNEEDSPQFQLQKYYPEIYSNLKEKEFTLMGNQLKESLKRGVQMRLFRKRIDIDFVSRIYFNGLRGIRDIELFPPAKHTMNNLIDAFFEYHLRAICTKKGILLSKKYAKEEKFEPTAQ